MPAMKVIVVTGGIASGKSTAVGMLMELGGKGVEIFDCDEQARRLRESGALTEELAQVLGPEVLDEQGQLSTESLRRLVESDAEKRAALGRVVHPRLAAAYAEAVQAARERDDVHTFILDAPLYFESESEFPADMVCVVACSPSTQKARLMRRNGFSEQEAELLMGAQMPTDEKMRRADVVFWNEGARVRMQAQVQVFFNTWVAPEVKALQARSRVFRINELRLLPLNELVTMAREAELRYALSLPRAELTYELMRFHLNSGAQVLASGVLEFCPGGEVVLRDGARSFRPGKDDPLLPNELVRRFGLRPGQEVSARLRLPRHPRENGTLVVDELLQIEGVPAADFQAPKEFEKLTPLIPRERLILENNVNKAASMRVLDLITPLGLGQRALIVAPPRGGKTVLLKTIAGSLRANYPELDLLILLLDERPEEVTDFEETVDAPVYASTFDEPSKRHAQLSDLVLERARRLVEQGRNVVIMLDSLTRLARGYNANQVGGRTMSGGLGSNALEKPRKFFGAARNVEEGGSLTIIATCLVDTESRMDEIIFEEFKGTGNMEIRLDRDLAERRIYPAISIPQSGTRNDDRLYHPDELVRVLQLRRQLAMLPGWEGLETLKRNIAATQNNAELLLRGLR